MKKIRTVILDDEPDSIKILQIELEKYFPQIEIIGVYTSPLKAVKEIQSLRPDLLFLDIEMPVMNGFDVLETIGTNDFNVIFVTAYNHFAIKAFRFNALDYLVKPFDSTELIQAVSKAEKQLRPTPDQLIEVKKQLRGETVSKLAIPSSSGISFIDFAEIIYVEASDNYSKLVLTNGNNIIISRTLKDVQEVLEERHFLRVHRQFIINLNYLKQFNRNESILTMNNGVTIPIARNQKEKIMERFGWL